jgi:hypothetical protein
MDNMKPQRRRFQFSLRKLMLWFAVFAAYLIVVQVLWVAYTSSRPRATGYPRPFLLLLILSACLPLLAFIRVRWGFRRGCRIAVLATAVVFGCLYLLDNLHNFAYAISLGFMWHGTTDFIGRGVIGFVVGAAEGFAAFTAVHLTVFAIDFIDGIMQNKTHK